ncbi:MAG TPA: hypothetical protein VF503_33075 [Sphingobium sp.]|uniref:YncE family protein n=1 Tax=Sphingobium sp. TaxID=1912891 RepID=UPI002ED55367
MKKLHLGLAACLALSAATTSLPAATMFMGAYPDELLTFDEGTGAVTQKVKLSTGLPTSMRLSNDDKLLYVTTITTSGIEVIDVATRKVLNSFSLNTSNEKYRFNGGVPDPTGRYFYTVATRMEKQADRYMVGKPQYVVIDLKLKKIVRTRDLDAEDDTGSYRNGFMLSQDGKSLYLLRDKVIVVNTADLKVAQRFDLSKPELSGMENVNFGGGVQSMRSPREFVSLFNASDPYIHNKMFGIARMDLATREFTFAPIGPAPSTMSGLEVTPDGKLGYAVITNGTLGNKRCEFWSFDLATNKVIDKSEFECRSRFTFGMSGDGTKLYIYGASYDIEVYDARTLKYEKKWDLGNDATMAGMVITQ